MSKKKKGACVIFEKPVEEMYGNELNSLDKGSADDYLSKFFPENQSAEVTKPQPDNSNHQLYDGKKTTVGEDIARMIMNDASLNDPYEDAVDSAAKKAVESYLSKASTPSRETPSNKQYEPVREEFNPVPVEKPVNKAVLSDNKKFISLMDPFGHVIKAPVIDYVKGDHIKDDRIFEELAIYITVALAPAAIYTANELNNLLDENYIQAFPMNIDLMTSEHLDEYVYLYKYEESLVQNLVNIADVLGEEVFATTVCSIVDACAQFNVMGTNELMYVKTAAMYNTKTNEIKKDLLIKEIKDSFDGSSTMHEINSYNMTDFITTIQYDTVMSLIINSDDNSENIKEEYHDSRECDDEDFKDEQEGIPDMVEHGSGESGTDGESGNGYSEILQNPYEGEFEELGPSDVQQFDGYREIGASVVQEEQEEKETQEEARPVNGDIHNEPEREEEQEEEETQEEQEEEVSMVIPVRRG